MRIIRIIAAAGLILIMILNVGCSPAKSFDAELNAITKPYGFSIAGWEFSTFFDKIKHVFNRPDTGGLSDTEITNRYISLHNQINDLKNQINSSNQSALQTQIDSLQAQQNKLTIPVENIIKKQTAAVLKDMGIYQPWYKYIKLKFVFPAPDFKIEPLPHLLVVSDRNTIDRKKDVLLKQTLSLPETVNIETATDNLNVSSLVVELGGIGTYPSLVSSSSDFQYLVETCAHEWTHAYLAFKPIGFRYVLNIAGITNNGDITTMNEATADIIGKEVGGAVIKKYYPQFQTAAQTVQPVSQTAAAAPAFNFNQAMHSIRLQVDAYLAAGQVNTAEQYMDQQQVYLAANGYYIRKLNQAYFAFYGSYADTPAYENPIGTKINQLRAESTSLQGFLNTMSVMTGVSSLNAAVK